MDESDWGGRTRRAARTTSTCQETKKGENNIQGTIINIPASPEVINREKDTPHNPYTPRRQPHPSKQRTASDPPRHPCRLTGTNHTGTTALPTSPNTETMNAGKQAAERHGWGERATSDKPNRTARRNGRPAPPHAQTSDKQSGERGTHDTRGTEKARGKQPEGGGTSDQQAFEAQKKDEERLITSSPSPVPTRWGAALKKSQQFARHASPQPLWF